MKLSNRLKMIASKVPQNTVLADIGTDHAFIPVFLIKNKICHKVIAADINKGPLERANKYIVRNGLKDNIETRLGSGLTVLKPGEVDTVIIAGMGGMLIKDILEASPEILKNISKLILQPMIGQEVAREWLIKSNFKIVDESLTKEEDKIYQIIVAEHGFEDVEDDIYYEIGKKLIENGDPLLKELVEKKIDKAKQVISQLQVQNTEKIQERLLEMKELLRKYYKILQEL